MEKKDISMIYENGQLPDPETINVISVIDTMWELFYDTTNSQLGELEAAALALEDGIDIEQSKSHIRRLLHSIKGNSGAVGLADVSNVCHHVESAFEKMSDTTGSASMILKVKDWLQSILEHLSNKDMVFHKQQQLDQMTEKPKLKALIIDDAQICRSRLKSILQDFFDCSFAVNGREGLEAYIESMEQNRPFDFITLDIHMPEMDGHETLMAIRKWEEEHGIGGFECVKVIMLTSESTSKHVLSSFRQGCEAYVVKSNMGEKLLDEVVNLGLLKIVKVEKNYAVG